MEIGKPERIIEVKPAEHEFPKERPARREQAPAQPKRQPVKPEPIEPKKSPERVK